MKTAITTLKTKRKFLVGKPRPQRRPRKIVEEIFNIPERLTITTSIEPLIEQTISITKTSNKKYKPKMYDEAVNNPIYGR